MPELLRKYGVAEGTCDRWRAKHGGMEVSNAKRLKALEKVREVWGLPERLLADNGLEFIEPRWPIQNGYTESFNGKLRDECLN